MTSTLISPAQMKQITGIGHIVAVDWRELYLGKPALDFVGQSSKVSAEKSVPYSQWRWRSLEAPGHRQDGPWLLEHARFRRHMEMGGILICVGPTGTGKTSLLENLRLKIIENWRVGMPTRAPLAMEDLPPTGLFAIDETHRHDPLDVSSALHHAAAKGRGFALVFQSPNSVRNYDIWPMFSDRNVLILQLTR